MSDNKRIGIRIAALIETLIEEIQSLKPDEFDLYDISDVYEDIYDLQLMSDKYCPEEVSA